ncbi:hypothetical protein [Thermogymnomonas acidicola]|uniref:hypothetical protein n=1 Tax=Thermogymnomonas acidicola TaxID=399579 RepID=UPI0009463962|nr:hypothetical protein [Thermogymnomonas acidicola]
MRYTLNSLILRTRFTRGGFLALTVLLLLYSGLIGFFSPHSNDDVIYALTFTAFLFLVIGVSGGVAVRRPDRDFLFTMPLDRRKLGSSLLLAQFLTTGVSEAYFLFVIFRFLGHPPIAIGLAVVALIGTAGMLTGVGIINYSLTLPRRVVVSAVMALLALSPLLGFRYSFTSPPLVSYSPPRHGCFSCSRLNLPGLLLQEYHEDKFRGGGASGSLAGKSSGARWASPASPPRGGP